LIMISRTMQRQVDALIPSKVGELAVLVRSLAASLKAVTSAFVQVLSMQPPAPVVDDPARDNPLEAALRAWEGQYRTVLGQTPSCRALARTPTPSAACTTMRACRASCCGVEWVRTRCSSASRGMATSCSSSGFVLPQHSRFDSSNLFAKRGVKTSARLY
jgi:hypothetical protein